MADQHFPAFPIESTESLYSGLSKRELFAIVALQAFISRGVIAPDDAAAMAIIYADTLLRELES